MKSTKTDHLLNILLIFIALMVLSCNNDDGSPPVEPAPDITYQIVKAEGVNTAGNIEFEFSYNSDGKFNRVSFKQPDGKVTIYNYTYSESTITMDNGDYSNTTIFNEVGQATRIYNENDGIPTVTEFVHINGKLAKSIYEYNNNGTPTETLYEWEDGNVVKRIESWGEETKLEYYTDQAIQPGDFQNILDMVEYGTFIYGNANLIKSTTTKSGTRNFEYEFDDIGRVSSLSVTQDGAPLMILHYSYAVEP